MMDGHHDGARPPDIRAASPELVGVVREEIGGGMRWSFSLEPTPRAPGIARRAIEPLSSQMGRRADDVRLLLSELVANAVLHGGDRHAASLVRFQVRLLPARVHVSVCDDGPGFAPEQLRGSVRGREGGRGLEILSMVADRVGVGGPRPFRVWFELDL